MKELLLQNMGETEWLKTYQLTGVLPGMGIQHLDPCSSLVHLRAADPKQALWPRGFSVPALVADRAEIFVLVS